MKILKIICISAAAILLTLCFGCGSDECGEKDLQKKERKFLFGMRDDPENVMDFVAVSADSAVIAAAKGQLSKPVEERNLHINGVIAYGNGGHNLSWSWHFVPHQWSLAEMSIELCDGNPLLVEQDIDYWVGTVGRFCPWSSYVKKELPVSQ